MIDVRLINILPAAPGQGVQPPPVSQSTGGQTPGVTLNLPTGSILSGFIVNRDGSGNPILRTEGGDVTFQTDFFLKIGSEVVIRIGNRAGAPTANIISVNGQPPQEAQAQPTAADTPEVIVNTPARQPAARVQLPATNILTGTLLPKTENADAVPLTFRIVSVAVPKAATAAPNAVPPPVSATVAAPATPQAPNVSVAQPTVSTPKTAAPAATPTAAPAATIAAPPTATPVQPPPAAAPVATPAVATAPTATPTPAVTVAPTPAAPSTVAAAPAPTSSSIPVVPAPTAATIVPPPVPGQVVTATLVRQDAPNEALVRIPAGLVRLTGVTLPPGSQITLEALPPGTSFTPLPPAPLSELAKQWTSLQHIATLLSTRPDSALSALPWSPLTNAASTGAALPAPQQISAGLIFFVAALRGGNFGNWLGGDNVRWLQQNGHDALLRKADAEFSTLVRGFTDAAAPGSSQPWQTLFFPVAVDGQLQQVRMFLKRDRRQDKKERAKKDDDTRFIVELSMSQLGEMQMDGLVRRQPDKPVEFDLFIRSLAPLAPDMQQDIVAIYNSFGELTGYRGNLIFQAVKEFPVNPMKEAIAAGGGVIA